MSACHILFRVDANNKIGLGHLRRCLVLAAAVGESGGAASFLLGGAEKEAGQLVRESGFPFEILGAEMDFTLEMACIADYALPEPNAVILDISHYRTFNCLDQFSIYLTGLQNTFGCIAVLDSYYSHSLRSFMPTLKADLVIAPYCGERPSVDQLPYRFLSGTRYFPMDPAYCSSREKVRIVSRKGKRIMVSCGGSDPAGVSMMVLAALETIEDRRLEVRVIVGPCFSDRLIGNIRAAIGTSRHQIEEIIAPVNLAEQMWWSDLAVSMTGLTKYELAATGTPAVLISVDAEHAGIHQAFAAEKTADHLGVYTTIDTEVLGKTVRSLLDNPERRGEMSRRGRNLVDGLGACRIVTEIGKHCNVAI